MTKISDVVCWRCGFYGQPVVYHTSDGDMSECNGCGVIGVDRGDSDTTERVTLRAEDDPRRTVYGLQAPKVRK